jgi:hypothetical protein
MMDLRNTALGLLLEAPRQNAVMAQRAQALQVDATFWEPGEQFDNHMHLPLWRAICAFKGANPAHWALSSPDQARTMQRHTTGDVSELLKEIVRLHDKAAGHAQAGGLKGFGDTAKSFKTTVHDLTEWAEKVGEAARQTPSGSSEQGQAKVVKNTTKGKRRDILAPVLEHAQSLCKNPFDTSEVWGVMLNLDKKHFPTFLHHEGEAIAYMVGDETKLFTRKKLKDRLRGQRLKPSV